MEKTLHNGSYLVLFCLLFCLLCAVRSQGAEGQALHGHIPSAVTALKTTGRLPGTNRLNLAISLPLRNADRLSQLFKEIYDPASPNFHHYLTPAQFTDQFGPTESDYQAVAAFAKAHGLKVNGTHPNRMLLDVSGSVVEVEQALHVKMQVYPHPTEARTFYAPDKEPSLDLATPVLHISGLENYSRPRPRFVKKPLVSGQKALPNAGSGWKGTYMGKDFRAAYVPDTTMTGSGQTVGLLQFDGYTASDITYYESHAGLPSVTLSNVLLDGFSGQPTGDGGEVEVSLDIEMSISMAPGLSEVLVYMAGPYGNFHDILNRMATDNLAKQLSCSWYEPGQGPDATAEQIFQEMAMQGQSFYAACGDYDAYTGPFPFPDDSPSITLVGGTTLTTSGPGGSWVSEKAWNWGGGIGTGGGISTYYPIPSYQTNINMTASQGSTNKRNVPDVALTADNVYVRADGQDLNVGGTSCASPLWAGFTALVNQRAVMSGRPTVGFINPAIDAIGSGGIYATSFHDITTGNNTSPSSPQKFFAVAGYDLCTGWGVPAGQSLINALAVPDPLEIQPDTGFTSAGGSGGPFTVTSESFVLTNSGTNSLSWSLVNTSSWLTVSPPGGTLAAGGSDATPTVSLSGGAYSLPIGNYTVAVAFSNVTSGIAQNRQFTLQIVPSVPPTIVTPPTDQFAAVGSNATFNVTAGGTPPLNYQWQVNTTNIGGATNATLTVTNVGFGDEGNYTVTVTNTHGSTNASATLTVGYTPVITASPVSQTAVAGTPVTFSASASAAGPMTVQWYYGTIAIAGATNTNLTVTASTASAGAYTALFMDAFGGTPTATATLTVLPGAFTNGGFEIPQITNGAIQSLVPGSTWLVGWTIGGNGGPIYLFTNGDSGTFGPYEGAQWLQFDAFNTAPGATLSQTFATTNGQSYGVSFALGAPGIGNMSMGVLVLAPNGAVITSNNYSPPNNSWEIFGFNFTAISTNATLEFIDTSTQTVAIDLALDDVVVGTTTNVTPVITLSPVSQTVLDGTLVTFTAAASNATSVQWYLGSLPIAGATNTTLMVTASSATAGSYRATFSNGGGSANTAAAVLTVVEPALINGGFEIPHLTNGAVQSLVPGSTWLTGWTIGGNGGAIYLFTNGDSGTFDSYEGAQWLQFNAYDTAAGATLSQTFATTSGDSYGASFALGGPGNGNVSMEVLVLAPNGTVMGSNSYTPPNNSWAVYTLNFTAVSTNATIEFIDTSAQTVAVDLTLDDVIVVDTSIPPPVITLSPVSQTVLDGAQVMFTAAASNATLVQWYLGSLPIAGATNTTLTVTASPTTAGSYRATFSNVTGSTNTASAVLTVVEPALINGGFEIPHLTNGAVQSLVPGSTWLTGWTIGGNGGAVYLFTNGDSGTFDSYEGAQWLQFNAFNTAAGATLSQTFATTSGDSYGASFALGGPGNGNVSMEVLVLAPNGTVMGSNSYTPPNNSWAVYTLNFTAVSTNATIEFIDTSAQTTAVDLTLDDVIVVDTSIPPPVITLSPVSQTVLDGAQVMFTAAASNATLVQWYLGSLPIAGATNTTLTVTASPTTAGSYRATFSNGGGSTNTAAAVLTVLESALINGGFEVPHLTNGAVQSLVPGSTWLTGWTIGGTGGAIYLFTNGDSGTFDSYEGAQWLQFNAYNTAAGATLSQTFATTSGDLYGVTFALGAPGHGNVSMGVLVLAPNGTVMGSNSYTPPNNSWALYTLNFTAVSTNATLKFIDTSAQTVAVDLALDDVVVGLSPVMVASPSNRTLTVGANVTLIGVVTGALPITYQWQFDNANILGATNASLTVTNVQLANAGSYRLVATNKYGSATSSNAVLTINTPPVIRNQPHNLTVTIPSSATFTVSALGLPPLFFQWQLNGTNLPGATGASFTVSNVVPSDSGGYSVIVSNSVASVISSNAVLLVNYLMETGQGQPQLLPTTNLTLPSVQPGNTFTVSAVDPASLQGGPLQLTNGSISYTPPVGFTGEDMFSYVLTPASGPLIQGTVTVLVGASLAMSVSLNGGQATIQFAGLPGTLYTVEASTDLINWTVIGSATAGPNGQFQFLDNNAGLYLHRYYRTSIP